MPVLIVLVTAIFRFVLYDTLKMVASEITRGMVRIVVTLMTAPLIYAIIMYTPFGTWVMRLLWTGAISVGGYVIGAEAFAAAQGWIESLQLSNLLRSFAFMVFGAGPNNALFLQLLVALIHLWIFFTIVRVVLWIVDRFVGAN